MGSTNCTSTFIRVADDCPASSGEVPPSPAKGPTVAALQHELLTAHPGALTSDDLVFAVHATRQAIPEAEQAQAREDFFARSQPCLRSSPLAKRYGWGLLHDADSRVSLVAVDDPRYRELAADESLTQLRAMRSSRA